MDWRLLRRLDHGGMHEEAEAAAMDPPMPPAMPPSAGHEHHMVMVSVCHVTVVGAGGGEIGGAS